MNHWQDRKLVDRDPGVDLLELLLDQFARQDMQRLAHAARVPPALARYDIFHYRAAQEVWRENALYGQAPVEFMEQPDPGMGPDLVLGPLGDNRQRATALGIANGEL